MGFWCFWGFGVLGFWGFGALNTKLSPSIKLQFNQGQLQSII